MGRFSPSVLPTGVSPFASAIAGLNEGMREGRQTRLENEDRTENTRLRRLQEVVTRAGLARSGVVPDSMLGGEDDLDDEGLGGMMPPPSMMSARAPAPPSLPSASSPPGSPQFQAGINDPAALFGEMAVRGRQPVPAEPSPGAWTPETGFYGVPTSRYSGAIGPETGREPISVGGGMSLDPRRTPEAMADERRTSAASTENARLRRAYQLAGIPENQLDAVIANPQLADNILFPDKDHPAKTTDGAQLRARIAELIKGGMTLEKANTQARMEFGQSSPTTATDLSPNQRTQRSQTYLSRFNNEPAFKDATAVAAAYDVIKGLGANATAASDLSMVFAFMKMLDPDSVVRETEQANAQNAAGVPDRIRNLWNRTLTGERLTPDQRADFTNQAKTLAEARRTRLKGTIDRYTAIAKRNGMDPADIVFDPFDQDDDTPPPASGAKPGAAASEGASASAIASQDEYDYLVAPKPNGAGMTDAQVAARYQVPASIKRKKGRG